MVWIDYGCFRLVKITAEAVRNSMYVQPGPIMPRLGGAPPVGCGWGGYLALPPPGSFSGLSGDAWACQAIGEQQCSLSTHDLGQ